MQEKYCLQKSASKTAIKNNLLFKDGNAVSNLKLLFDFSFIDSLEIPESEKDAIKSYAAANCSIVNDTAFVFHVPDQWTVCDATVTFVPHKVYHSKTWKLMYVILEVKHIKYYHAERKSVYENYYTQNVKEFETDNKAVGLADEFDI